MPSTIFAQFCQELETIVDISSYTVVNAYKFPLGFGPPSPWDISQNDFLNLFYSQGLFKLSDCCNNIMQTDHWWVGPLPGGSVNIPKLVMDQWALDASGGGTFNWETCSNLVVKAELLQSRDLCTLDCNVCCALTLRDIIADLNSQDHVHRTPGNPFRSGDILILSLLFTNDSTLVNPVVFFFHFQIT